MEKWFLVNIKETFAAVAALTWAAIYADWIASNNLNNATAFLNSDILTNKCPLVS